MSQQEGIVACITRDHRKAETLFDLVSAATTNDEKKKYFALLIKELSIHTAVEERIVYPVIPSVLPDGHQMYEKLLADHQSQKEVLAELESLDVTDPKFNTRFNFLKENVLTHVRETEEKDILPKLEAALTLKSKMDMGANYERAKYTAPTHPHPSAPNKGFFGSVAQVLSAPIDSLRDAAKGLHSKEAQAREDVVKAKAQTEPKA